MIACLRRFQWRSDTAIYPLCMSLAGRTGRARAALDGAVGRRVSGGRFGERLGRLGLRPGQDRSPAWFPPPPAHDPHRARRRHQAAIDADTPAQPPPAPRHPPRHREQDPLLQNPATHPAATLTVSSPPRSATPAQCQTPMRRSPRPKREQGPHENVKTTRSPVTESDRRPSPYHAHLFCRMVSRWVELRQFEAMGVSRCVVLCLSSAGGVVTWFVTEQSDVGGVWPDYAKPRSRSRRPRSNRATRSGSTGGCPSESQHGGLVRGCSGSSMPSAAYNSR